MKNLYFEDYDEFMVDICDKFETAKAKYDLSDISIIAKYEEARKIIAELVCLGYDIRSIAIEDEEIDGYDAEYIISISNFDGKDEIWCEPMLRDTGYVEDISTISYILDNCSSAVIPYCKSDTVYEVTIGVDDEDYEDECDDLDELYDIDDNTHGFTISNSDEDGHWSYSFYSTDKDLVVEMAKLFR